MDDLAVKDEAVRIVDAIARRSQQDPGMTVDQVQQLLVLRVREEADRLGVRPRALMGAVWHAWEAQSRPPLLGPTETRRVIERLAERGLLVIDATGNVHWCGLSDDELKQRLRVLEPPLDHEESLFLEGIRRHMRAREAGAWFSWEVEGR
jgi:hypothetical protein